MVVRVMARCSRRSSASPELGLQGVDLGAEIVGQGPGGVFLEVECLEEGVEVHAPATRGSRQVSVFASVRRRAMTWVMAQ